MLEKTPGVIRTNTLRIIQLLEADRNQLLRLAFTRNTRKIAQDKDEIISEHQYGILPDLHFTYPEQSAHYPDFNTEKD
jgi:hypothetical protein